MKMQKQIKNKIKRVFNKNSSPKTNQSTTTTTTFKKHRPKFDNSNQKINLEKKSSEPDDNSHVEFKKQKALIVPEGKWFQSKFLTDKLDEKDPSDGTDADGANNSPLTRQEIQSIRTKAEKLLEKDIQAHKSGTMKSGSRSDFLWMDKILRSGTLPDKMAAYTVKIQDSPVHNLSSLQNLLSLIKIQGKQQCLMAADTARDLFLEDLLPPNRKLLTLDMRGPELRTASNPQLILWIFEEKLRAQYCVFIECLKKMVVDTIDKLRGKAISIIHQLLTSHPEQEEVLLPLLVNKLGDPVKKVGSRALFHLNKLLEVHPVMKSVVVEEVERLIFRNNVGKRAQYYGICFLKGIRVDETDSALAVKLIRVYLAFFKACVKTGEIEGRMMSGLLGGVNKAFPTAKLDGYQFTESLDTLYKIVQLSHFNIATQALALLLHVTDVDKTPHQADRFYRVLYRKLLSPELSTSSHAMQFLNVIYKAMNMDNVHSRVIGFTKRLVQLSNQLSPNLACAILLLISEVSKKHEKIILLGSQLSDKKIEELEMDTQITAQNPEEVQILAKTKKNKSIFRQEDIESFIKSSNIILEEEEPKNDENNSTNAKNVINAEVKDEKHCKLSEYDPNARNPSYCGAQLSLCYELITLLNHYHPSVALFSQKLINEECIEYDGNPLKDFTISRFLERFVYRNAKAKRVKFDYQPKGLRNLPVNSSNYLMCEESKIPIEERFFYKYFKDQKSKSSTKKSQKSEKEKNDDESDIESVDDDEFDDIMSNYYKNNVDESDDDEGEDVDFMSEIVKESKKSKKRKMSEENDDESDEGDNFSNDEIDDDDDNEAIDFDGDDDADEFVDLDDDDDSKNDQFLDMDEDDDEEDLDEFGGEEFTNKLKEKTRREKKGRKMGKISKNSEMFAPAEEFSELLESNADAAFSGLNTLINKDNSNQKQLMWESDRDRWVKGYKHSSKTYFNKNKKTKKKFNNSK